MTENLQIDIHLGPSDIDAALRHDVRVGLSATPRWLPPKWFYDERGSELFEQITRLPEYYPTRREAEILDREAKNIVLATGADTLVELGSGSSEKTLVLLDAFQAARQLERFMPFDVSEATLRNAAEHIDRRYPGIAVHAVVGDFDHHLRAIPHEGQRLVAFLGGTIGNLDGEQRATFLDDIAVLLESGEHLLLGTDLVKDRSRLLAAYDDRAGVTAEFNRNVLHVINRELGGDFEPDVYEHVAIWNEDFERIEMWLEAPTDQHVEIAAIGLQLDLAAGERIRTELSCKFTPRRIDEELDAAGFSIVEQWSDERGDFALTLAARD